MMTALEAELILLELAHKLRERAVEKLTPEFNPAGRVWDDPNVRDSRLAERRAEAIALVLRVSKGGLP